MREIQIGMQKRAELQQHQLCHKCLVARVVRILPVHINSENLTLHMHALIHDSMYKHALLTDFVLFKYNYCVESVINVLKVTDDEVCTDISISSVCEPVTLNHQISHNHGKSMILKTAISVFTSWFSFARFSILADMNSTIDPPVFLPPKP
ncbi:hypothetical protein TSAR_000599 [Trichomalopsis sarcophagae]|uniref:Uncharacterized protein n=1 Tax=Trichomalopsis sarcophagae TaxID=543379 RepID=A0A232F5I3_9HYME|nr:hypothetical protein TSAR_000599 [Trichomalopsis sarcophagae]